MNFQSIFCFEICITLVTLKGCTLLLFGFQISYNRRFRSGFLSKKLLSAIGISPEGGWAAPLLDPCRQSLLSLPGVQGEGEGGADGDGELKHLALACQCLAEVQALGRQRGVSLTHCSHFCLLLNYQNF